MDMELKIYFNVLDEPQKKKNGYDNLYTKKAFKHTQMRQAKKGEEEENIEVSMQFHRKKA